MLVAAPSFITSVFRDIFKASPSRVSQDMAQNQQLADSQSLPPPLIPDKLNRSMPVSSGCSDLSTSSERLALQSLQTLAPAQPAVHLTQVGQQVGHCHKLHRQNTSSHSWPLFSFPISSVNSTFSLTIRKVRGSECYNQLLSAK